MSSQQPFEITLNGQQPSTSHILHGAVRGREAHMNKGGAGGNGDVQHIHYLSDHIGALFLNDEYSDVALIVEGQCFRAHRVILAARSEYFRALLFGGMKESRLEDIELRDTPLQAFRQLLRYIYTGHMSLANQKDELILDILGLAHQYGFTDLETAISDYLRLSLLSIRNVSLIYDTASLYQLQNLVNACCSFVDRNASEVIKHESLTALTASSFQAIISRDSFCAPEVDIFLAAWNWDKANPDATEEERAFILSAVRLPLMSTQDLLKTVRPTNVIPPDVILDAIQSRTESRDMELKYRGYLIQEENVATPRHGAMVIAGEVATGGHLKTALLDGETKNFDMERGFTRHPIDDREDRGIVVRLGMPCIINHLRLLLWDKEQRAYSYHIDVSMDQKDWDRVVDHSKYHCRSWQNLYFKQRVVRFIRITGTNNTVNKVFHAVSLEAYYTNTSYSLDQHKILIPKENVATIPMSAIVKEGVCRSRNALLNGDTNNYNWDSGYTCHQLGSGSIVVQLGQPYAIESMRLLLWDCDERSYSYFIEVSNNEKDWEVVWDRSKVACRSWQTITFPRRPIVYIRIVGTHNTANEVFHCVHFECPAVTNCGATLAVGAASNKSMINEDLDQESMEQVGAAALSPSTGSSEGDEASSSASENLQDEDRRTARGGRMPQRYGTNVSDSGIGNIHQRTVTVAAITMSENGNMPDSRAVHRVDDTNRSTNKIKKRDKRVNYRNGSGRHISYPQNSVSGGRHRQNDREVERSSTVGNAIASDIASSRASVVTVAAVLDDVASTVANAAEQEEEQQQIIKAEDETIDGESVTNGDGDLADVNDATETQSQISHHSSPASYAGSVSGHSTAGISANNSLPVGASACSMARQCQQEQFGQKQVQQGTSQHNSASTAFNFRVLSQQSPLTDTQATGNIVSTSVGTRINRQQSPSGSASPSSSPSSPAPNDQHTVRQSTVSFKQ